MTAGNGQRPAKPAMDVNLLTPNDYRRLRAALGDSRDLDELLASGQPEDVVQTLILGFKLREDPGFTWEQAGDTTANDVFDLASGREPDPPTGPPGSPGLAAAPPTGRRSKPKRAAPVSAPNS
jgi:hypothetical protein